MAALDFLYLALGIGFIILVIFLCVLIMHIVLVLRDVTKISGNFREASDRIREAILEPMKVLSEMSAGFGIVHDLIEKIRAKQAEAAEEDLQEMSGDEVMDQEEKVKEKPGKKPKSGFLVKKLRK